MEVLNSPLGLTETLLEFFFPQCFTQSAFPWQWRMEVGIRAWLVCFARTSVPFYFFHWEQCKRFQVEIWLGFLFG